VRRSDVKHELWVRRIDAKPRFLLSQSQSNSLLGTYYIQDFLLCIYLGWLSGSVTPLDLMAKHTHYARDCKDNEPSTPVTKLQKRHLHGIVFHLAVQKGYQASF